MESRGAGLPGPSGDETEGRVAELLAVCRLPTLRQSAAHDLAVLAIVAGCVLAGAASVGAALFVFQVWTFPFRRWMWRR